MLLTQFLVLNQRLFNSEICDRNASTVRFQYYRPDKCDRMSLVADESDNGFQNLSGGA